MTIGWIMVAWLASALGAAPSVEGALTEELARLSRLPENTARWVGESRVRFYEGEYATDDEKAQNSFRVGRELAAKAKAVQPEDSAARFWWVANHAGLARVKRNLWSLGALKDVERELKALMKDDGAYGFGAAARMLGLIYLEAPRIVSIGSSSRSESTLRPLVEQFPRFPGNQLALAEWAAHEEETELLMSWLTTLSPNSWSGKDWGEFQWEIPLWNRRLAKLQSPWKGAVP